MTRPDLTELGERLYVERFLPLPDVTDTGELIGTRLWRVRHGYVECLAIRTNGLGLAVRADAQFSYHEPAAHGAIRAHMFGAATSAFAWLLRTVDEQPEEGRST
jgi:hypothetical protein